MLALGNNYTSGIYTAGLYLRLSREDEDNTEVSQSIINQKDFLTEYAITNGLNIIDYYIDDGYSGTNFDRPDFNRLIEDIENKRINTVVTKDLSRLGRDYIMTGYYIEKYFPSKNVRYIAITDGVDSYVENSNDMTPFKAVINDMYAKDISRKVRTAKTTQKLRGDFIGAFAPYGYKKSEDNKNKLVIDEEKAIIVKRIFKMAVDGMSIKGIAQQLSNEKIPTPSAVKNLTRTQKGVTKGLWNTTAIQRILTNPTYIGNLTQNRLRKVSYKVDKLNHIPKEQWITIPDTHEAIVSEEDFDTVQSLLSKRSYTKTKNEAKNAHLLSGLVFCADCKKSMTFSTSRGKYIYLVCSIRRRYGICVFKSIREDVVENIVIGKIKEIAKKYVDKQLLIENADPNNQYTDYVENLTKEQEQIHRQLDEIQTYIMNLYKDKVKNIVTEQNFVSMSKEFNEQSDKLKERLNQIEKEINQTEQNKNNVSSVAELLEQFLKFEHIDRITLVTLIDRIEVHKDKTVEVKFNFIEP